MPFIHKQTSNKSKSPSSNIPTKSLGYYGIIKVHKLCKSVFIVHKRLQTKEKFLLQIGKWTKCIFSRRLSEKYRLADFRNDLADEANLKQIESISNNKKRVLYILDFLTLTGGVERRLALQFDWLIHHDIQPILVAEKMEYAPLAQYPTLRFYGYAPNAQEKLIELIRWSKASVVEFNMKDPCPLHDLDLVTLKQFARVGCMIHGEIQASQNQLDILDYRCSSRAKPSHFRNIIPIPNVVCFPPQTPQYNARSNKAIYIGRIDSEKLKTIISFVSICQVYGLEFEIAGPIYPQVAVTQFVQHIGLKHFIGSIDTRSFLQERGNEYIFVAGVGQVALESAAVNLPTLIPTHGANARQSVFLSEENLELLLDWNCVLRELPSNLLRSNLDEFFKTRDLCLKKQHSIEILNKYRLRNRLKKLRNPNQIWSNYMNVLCGS